MYGMTPSATIEKRASAPPEKVLNTSRMPPLCVWYSVFIATGSMPGTGTNDSRRKRISAPIVNNSRFLSSVAF